MASNRNNISRALQIFFGRVSYSLYQSGRPGVEASPLYKYNVAPALAVAAGISASQSVTGAVGALINGSLATASVATFDVPRNVVAAWTNTTTITITGTDVYGAVIHETSASGTSHTGKKAFKTITSIVPAGSITGFTAGSGSVLGLPFRVDASDLHSTRFNNVSDTGTFVPADTTSPATALTGDTRGTFAPAGTLDGVKKLSMLLLVADTSTKIGAFGVDQF